MIKKLLGMILPVVLVILSSIPVLASNTSTITAKIPVECSDVGGTFVIEPQGLAPMAVNAGNIGLREMRAEHGGFTLELWETAGKETAYELYCEAYDFGFRALFAPWEIRRFFVDANGFVSEPLAK